MLATCRKLFEIIFHGSYMRIIPQHMSGHVRDTIDTEIKAKRNNMISELITFWITKAKAKVKFGVKSLCELECEVSSVQLISMRKRKRQNILGELISL